MQEGVVIAVAGLGCHRVPDAELLVTRDNIRKVARVRDVHLECNRSLKNTLCTIARTACDMRPSRHDPFVKSVTRKVGRMLDDGRRVLVVGHSYGGSVAAKLAESLRCSHKAHENLRVVTFGSIYVPRPACTPIDTMHYMFLDDIALYCNKLRFDHQHVSSQVPKAYAVPQPVAGYDHDNRVVWLTHNIERSKLGLEQLEVHGSYQPVIDHVLTSAFL